MTTDDRQPWVKDAAPTLAQDLDDEIARLEQEFNGLKSKLTALRRRRARLKATEASAAKRRAKADTDAERICDRWAELGADGAACIQVAAEFGLSLRHVYRLIRRSYHNALPSSEEASPEWLEDPPIST